MSNNAVASAAAGAASTSSDLDDGAVSDHSDASGIRSDILPTAGHDVDSDMDDVRSEEKSN